MAKPARGTFLVPRLDTAGNMERLRRVREEMEAGEGAGPERLMLPATSRNSDGDSKNELMPALAINFARSPMHTRREKFKQAIEDAGKKTTFADYVADQTKRSSCSREPSRSANSSKRPSVLLSPEDLPKITIPQLIAPCDSPLTLTLPASRNPAILKQMTIPVPNRSRQSATGSIKTAYATAADSLRVGNPALSNLRKSITSIHKYLSSTTTTCVIASSRRSSNAVSSLWKEKRVSLKTSKQNVAKRRKAGADCGGDRIGGSAASKMMGRRLRPREGAKLVNAVYGWNIPASTKATTTKKL